MATDIFSFHSAGYDKGFKEPETGILIGSGSNKMTLIQQWQIQYSQQVTPVFECGTSTVYFSAKHANGTMTISRIVHEDPKALLSDLGQVCDPKEFTLAAYSGDCNGRSGVKLEIHGMIAQSIGFQGQAQQAYVSEDIQTMFASLSVSKAASLTA